MNTSDIHKAAGILIRDRRILVSREHNKTIFFAPGGKVDSGETVIQALIRELEEELGITVTPDDVTKFGVFTAPAAGQEHRTVTMEVYLVNKWRGEPAPCGEVEDLLWLNSQLKPGVEIGSIFEHEVIPQLKQRNLID